MSNEIFLTPGEYIRMMLKCREFSDFKRLVTECRALHGYKAIDRLRKSSTPQLQPTFDMLFLAVVSAYSAIESTERADELWSQTETYFNNFAVARHLKVITEEGSKEAGLNLDI